MANKALLVFLVFASSASFSAYADISWSIDCGYSGSFIDGIGIVWTGDDTLIKTGKTKLVETSNSVKDVLSTLRVFTSGTKNCYKLKAEKGIKVLIRANFYYGNYDGKASPPSFGLQFDGIDWATVETDMDAQNYLYYEAIYVTKFDTISVCLVQTNPKQYPFISGLEIRSLDSDMYPDLDNNHALANYARYAFGATTTVRYPDDKYDRIWNPAIINGANYGTDSSTADIINTNVPDKPPQVAISNAVAPVNTSERVFEMTTVELPASKSTVYINLYFLELSQLDSTEKRSFHVYLDNKRFSDDPITPLYASVIEFSITNVTASKTSKISLKSTNDSTLPPLLNAMEMYSVENFTLSATGSSSSSSSSTKLHKGFLCVLSLFFLLMLLSF